MAAQTATSESKGSGEEKRNELNKNKHTYRKSAAPGGQTSAWETKLNWIAWHDDSAPTPRLISQSGVSAFRSGYAIETGTRLQGNAPSQKPPTSHEPPTATHNPPPTTHYPSTHTHIRLLWGFVCDFWVKFYSNLFALRRQKEVLCANTWAESRGPGVGEVGGRWARGRGIITIWSHAWSCLHLGPEINAFCTYTAFECVRMHVDTQISRDTKIHRYRDTGMVGWWDGGIVGCWEVCAGILAVTRHIITYLWLFDCTAEGWANQVCRITCRHGFNYNNLRIALGKRYAYEAGASWPPLVDGFLLV